MKKKCTLVLISVLTVACIVSAYLLFFYNPSFNMVYDSDTDSYFNNSYLSYNDGTLAAADYRKLRLRLMIQKQFNRKFAFKRLSD